MAISQNEIDQAIELLDAPGSDCDDRVAPVVQILARDMSEGRARRVVTLAIAQMSRT